jgi:hypothetical protein
MGEGLNAARAQMVIAIKKRPPILLQAFEHPQPIPDPVKTVVVRNVYANES